MVEENSLYGLAYDCPHRERQVDCPFMCNEHLPFYEKVQWINNLGTKEKETILKYHQV